MGNEKNITILAWLPLITFAESTSDKRLVSELSINELKQIVRSIVEESIETMCCYWNYGRKSKS